MEKRMLFFPPVAFVEMSFLAKFKRGENIRAMNFPFCAFANKFTT